MTAFTLNTETLAGLSEYDSYVFGSLAELSGTYLATLSDGIYELEGDADSVIPAGLSPPADPGTPIVAKARTGLMDLSTSARKTIPDVYLGYAADGRLVVKVTASERGEKTESWYEATQDRETADTLRFKLGKGIKGRYLGIEISNPDGQDFEVEVIQIRPVVLERRL